MPGNRGVMGMVPPPRNLSFPSSPPPEDQELPAPPAPTPRGSSCWQPFPNLVPLCHVVSPSPVYPTPRCFPLGQGALNASSRDRATFVGAVGWLRGRGSSRRHLQPPRGLLGTIHAGAWPLTAVLFPLLSLGLASEDVIVHFLRETCDLWWAG